VSTNLIYLDSSVALRAILDVPERGVIRSWLQAPGATFVSSRLLRTEIVRTLRRERYPVAMSAQVLDRVGLFDISGETHAVAESIERHVEALDAIHLATALIFGEPVTVATHDASMKSVAEHLGFLVIDPVESV